MGLRPRAGPRRSARDSRFSESRVEPDLLDLEIDVDDAGEVVEDLGGLVVVAARHEEARGLGQAEGEEPVDEGGHGLGQEHPAPGRHAEPEGLGRAVGEVREHGVGQQGDEDADDNGQLLEGAQAPAHARRGDLGDVGRGDDGGRPHSQAADDAPDDEVDDPEGQTRPQGAGHEHDRGDEHDRHPAHAVGDRSGEPGADGAADERRGHGEALERVVEDEFAGQGVDGAVDDRGVEAEQEPAQGRGHADADDSAVNAADGGGVRGGGRGGGGGCRR